MGGFHIKQKGSFQHLESFLAKVSGDSIYEQLDQVGRQGVAALANATPLDSGITAASWSYEVIRTPWEKKVTWRNNHVAGDTPVVILLQYGHATGTGGYVQGQDFINPAIAKTFEDAIDGVWKAVVQA